MNPYSASPAMNMGSKIGNSMKGSNMELPYCVFDISNNDGSFKLLIDSIYEGTSETYKKITVSADFSIQLVIDGINANMECFLTVGNLYEFFTELNNCYDNLKGTAMLKYYSPGYTNIFIDFNARGGCKVHGEIAAGTGLRSGVKFSIECDQTYIKPNLRKLKLLFDDFAKIQGSYDFHY